MSRLELNWIGKYDKENQIQPEPRILIENAEYSYGVGGNMLIHGDNLLALKSLELEYSGRIDLASTLHIIPKTPLNTMTTT